MIIRRAKESDINDIFALLKQVLDVHHNGRPDIFKPNATKYLPEELKKIINDEKRPIFVADIDGRVVGYAFCIMQQYVDDNILTDIRTLYIDDLCVDEKLRGKHIGKTLYEYILSYAKEKRFYNITLNVWALNESARKFYDACGLSVQKTYMEKIL